MRLSFWMEKLKPTWSCILKNQFYFWKPLRNSDCYFCQFQAFQRPYLCRPKNRRRYKYLDWQWNHGTKCAWRLFFHLKWLQWLSWWVGYWLPSPSSLHFLPDHQITFVDLHLMIHEELSKHFKCFHLKQALDLGCLLAGLVDKVSLELWLSRRKKQQLGL